MKDLIEVSFNVAPQFMSFIGIIAVLVFIAVKVTVYYKRFKIMENDVATIKIKLDKLVDHLITGKVEALK
jgi:hypothetical protein